MENIRKYIATNEVITVENYPYGFRLRTSLFDSMEFVAKKGYRHVTQTINPKNDNLNKPKRSTYYPLLVRYFDENEHIKLSAFDLGNIDKMNGTAKFIFDHFNLFSALEIQTIKTQLLTGIKISVYAKIAYCGANKEDLELLTSPIETLIKESLNNNENTNIFDKIVFDIKAIENTYNA